MYPSRIGCSKFGSSRYGVARYGVLGGGGGSFPAPGYLQYLYGGTDDGLILLDTVGTLTQPQITNRSVLTMDGTDKITVPGLTGTDTVVCDGTSTPTAGTGEITFTAGTVANISINGTLAYACEEGEGLTLYSVNPLFADATIVPNSPIATIRGSTGDFASHNALYGHSPYVAFDGVDDYLNPSINTSTTLYEKIIFRAVDISAVAVMGNNSEWWGWNTSKFRYTHNGGLIIDIADVDTDWHTIEIDRPNNQIIFDGGSPIAITTTAITGPRFIGKIAAGFPQNIEIRQYYAVIGGVPARNLIPSPSNLGFVDTLTDTVYTNDGTGDLGIGRIPALTDGSADATGGTITNPGGVVHNQGVYDITQQDAYFTGGTVNFYSADGSSADDKTFAEFLDHYNSRNGGYNLWIKYVSPSVVVAAQYAFDKEWTPGEYINNVAFFGGTPMIPIEVTPGTGIGPDLDWYSVDGIHIVLVEDI